MDMTEPASPPTGPDEASLPAGTDRRRLIAEIWIVLGLSLGASAVYSVISITAKLTAGKPLAQQTSTLNASASARPYVDLAYQLADIVFTLVPVVLVFWLLSAGGRSAMERLGLTRRHWLTDLAFGAGLAALIGLPGLGFYFVGRELGVTTNVIASALEPYWWAAPVLIARAIMNAILEEVIVVGYLMTRLRTLGWPTWAVFASSAVLRGSYHLYQGIGPFFGNVIMGLVFAEWFRRTGRVGPLVVAHSLLDIVAFIGYQYFAGQLGLT